MIRFFTSAVLLLTLSSCTGAQMQSMRMQGGMKEVGEQITGCIETVRESDDYAPLREHIPFPIQNATLEQMGDRSKITNKQIKAFKKVKPQVVQCRNAALQSINGYAPTLAPSLIDGWQKSDKLELKLLSKSISWGDYVTGVKDISIQGMKDLMNETKSIDSQLTQAHYMELEQRQRAFNAMQQAQQNQQLINTLNRPRMTNCYGGYNTVNCTTY